MKRAVVFLSLIFVITVESHSLENYTVQSLSSDTAFSSLYYLDRLSAASETFEEIRKLFSNRNNLKILREDKLLQVFIKERIITDEIATTSQLSKRFRLWLYDSILDGTITSLSSLPFSDFKLLPAIQSKYWSQIWARSFVPLYSTNRYYTAKVNPHNKKVAFIRLAPSRRARVIDRVYSENFLNVLGREGGWSRIRTAYGLEGYIDASEVQLIAQEKSEKRMISDYYSMYGWVNLEGGR